MKDNRRTIAPSAQILELTTTLEPIRETLPEVMAHILSFGFYRAVETGVIPDARTAAVIRALCREQNIRRTEWASPFQNGEGLEPGSLDPSKRRHACERLKTLMRIAGDNGADAFAFLSGPLPADISRLRESVEAFRDTFGEIAEETERLFPDMDLMIEPLDRYVHKRGLIGPTREAVELLNDVRTLHENTFMAWDSAHVALNREDLVTSLRLTGDRLGQLHLCNAVLDEKDPLYGDYHISPGEKGYLTQLRCADTLREARKLFPKDRALPAAIEARPLPGESWREVEENTRRFLSGAISLCELSDREEAEA